MKLWLVTSRQLCRGNFLKTIEEAARAGLEAIILREKNLPPAGLYALALPLLKISGAYGPKLLISGSVEVAMAVGATGVHLGKDALPPEVVRDKLGYRGLMGVSVHSAGQALAAAAAGADYLLAGHIFATLSKQGLAPRGLALLDQIREVSSLPLVAIGGLGPHNIEKVLSKGVQNLAVMSYIMQHDDPYSAVRQLYERFGQP